MRQGSTLVTGVLHLVTALLNSELSLRPRQAAHLIVRRKVVSWVSLVGADNLAERLRSSHKTHRHGALNLEICTRSLKVYHSTCRYDFLQCHVRWLFNWCCWILCSCRLFDNSLLQEVNTSQSNNRLLLLCCWLLHLLWLRLWSWLWLNSDSCGILLKFNLVNCCVPPCRWHRWFVSCLSSLVQTHHEAGVCAIHD